MAKVDWATGKIVDYDIFSDQHPTSRGNYSFYLVEEATGTDFENARRSIVSSLHLSLRPGNVYAPHARRIIAALEKPQEYRR